jgi:hypothetical protein
VLKLIYGLKQNVGVAMAREIYIKCLLKIEMTNGLTTIVAMKTIMNS